MKTHKTNQLTAIKSKSSSAPFASNQQYIQKVANLTEVEYNTILFDMGMLFLEERFPAKPVYEEYFLMHTRNKKFWNWFIMEYKAMEHKIISQYRNSDIPLRLESYILRMNTIIVNRFVERSFNHHYLRNV